MRSKNMQTAIWIVAIYLLVGALWGGIVTLYGSTQGESPTWTVFGKSVVMWLPDLVQLVAARVRG